MHWCIDLTDKIIRETWLWIIVASKKPPSNLEHFSNRIGMHSNHTEHLIISKFCMGMHH